MTSHETIIENLRIIKRDQMDMYNRMATLESQVKLLQKELMSAVVDFKNYQLIRAKEALGVKQKKR